MSQLDTSPIATSLGTTSLGTTSLADHWADLATSALLGTDRRPVPATPPGPLGHVAAGRGEASPPERLLDQVSVLVAMRRAGVRPAPPAAPLVTCAPDPRPEVPAAAVARLEVLLQEWPHLLDEWLARANEGGWSLPADAVVLLLGRVRNDPERRSTVAALAGPLAEWLAGLFPSELAAKPGAKRTRSAEPDLPEDFARLAAREPEELAYTMGVALRAGHLANRHRALLVRLVSGVSVSHLGPLADELPRAASHPETIGLTLTLADLARFRLDLIRELSP